MKIAHIDKNNKLLGWYDAGIHETIPKPNVSISEEQWTLAINKGHNRVNLDGTTETFDFRTPEQQQADTVNHFKGLYLQVVDTKLKELDYDSLATVKLWENDPTFGAEAAAILEWYKSIIVKNYELLTAGIILTDEEYLAALPRL
jgi:hypothetical protein